MLDEDDPDEPAAFIRLMPNHRNDKTMWAFGILLAVLCAAVALWYLAQPETSDEVFQRKHLLESGRSFP